MQDNFADYGHTFQLKVIACLMSDKVFLQQIADIIQPNYFESQANDWIVSSILKYFKIYKSPPTNEVFKSEILELSDKLLVTLIIESLKESFKLQNSPDLEYVKNATIEFCKNQKMKVAILESVDLLKNGKFEEIKKKVDNALKAGVDTDVGHEYNISMDDRYAIGARVTVPTGWEVIDDLTVGGLAGGELGVLVAPAGGGKSWGLVSIAAHAIKQKKTVIYYTLELNQYYVGRRIDANLTNIAFQNLDEVHAKEKILSVINSIEGNLIIKYYPTKSASVSTIEAHIEKCISQGKTPDLIVIDYADLIRPFKSSDKRLELNDIYEDLRGLAGQYNIPIWTASQSNRDSTEEDIIQGNKVSESYNKVMVADFIMSLSRKLNDKIGGTGRWHIIKNRMGGDGMTFPSKINTTTGHIQIYEASSDHGKQVNGSMNGDAFVKKALSQKFKELETASF